MIRCLRCHRPLKNPPAGENYGPVCAKAVQPIQEVECDLFGFDIDLAALAAKERLSQFIAGRAALAKYEIRRDFYEARQRLRARP